MKLLIEIGHPAHVHLFRNLYRELINRGHEVFVFAKDTPAIKTLLSDYDIKYKLLTPSGKSIFRKGINMLQNSILLRREIRRIRPGIVISSTPSLMQSAWLMNVPGIFMDDDDDSVEPFVTRFAHPFASVILSPFGTERKSKKTIYYRSNHELAYLHPDYFTPECSVLNSYGLKPVDFFSIIRFVAMTGHHDSNENGFTYNQKIELLKKLSTRGPVIVTSEIDVEFNEGRIIRIENMSDIHSLLYYASIFVGDSQTMTSEAAMLGTPAFRCNTFKGRIAYLNEEEKAGLVYSFLPSEFEHLLNQIDDVISVNDFSINWLEKRALFISERVSLTKLLIWIIENYPESISQLRNDIDFPFKVIENPVSVVAD